MIISLHYLLLVLCWWWWWWFTNLFFFFFCSQVIYIEHSECEYESIKNSVDKTSPCTLHSKQQWKARCHDSIYLLHEHGLFLINNVTKSSLYLIPTGTVILLLCDQHISTSAEHLLIRLLIFLSFITWWWNQFE